MVQQINVLSATNKRKQCNKDTQNDHPDDQTMNNKSTREVVANFSEQTSIHGISHIQLSKNWFIKGLWMLAFATAVITLLVCFVNLIDKYSRYEIKLLSTQEMKPVAFPDVTLCPYRAMDISVIKSFHNRFSQTDDFFQAFFLENASMAIPQFENGVIKVLEPFKKLYETFGRLSNGSQVFNILLKKSTLFTMMNKSDLESGLIPNWEMMVRCRFQGDTCEQRNITFRTFPHPFFHKCMTFHSPKDINQGGVNGGLEIVGIYGSQFLDWTVNVTSDNSFKMVGLTEEGSALSGEQGVKVIVHPPNTEPNPTGEGYNVPSGFSCHVGVKVKEELHLHEPYGKCSNQYPIDVSQRYQTKKYVLMNCLRKCFQNRIIRKCKCVSGKLPLPDISDKYTFCENIFVLPENCSAPDVTPDISCLDHLEDNRAQSMCAINENYQANANQNIMEECGCFIPCHNINYDTQYSLAEWPPGPELDIIYRGLMKTENFFENLYKTQPNELKKKMYEEHFSFKNRVKGLKSLAKIIVYISDTTVTRTEETAAYTSGDLVSDLGGQMGFWAGMSCLSFCEVFQFFGELFSLIFHKSQHKVKPSSKI